MHVFLKFVALALLTVTLAGCSNRAISCVDVDGKSVCFIRYFWGLNGESVVLTASHDLCHTPSARTDFVAQPDRKGHYVFFKVQGGELHVSGSAGRMLKPKDDFPIKVVFDDFETAITEEFLKSKGYERVLLEDSRSCFSDILP